MKSKSPAQFIKEMKDVYNGQWPPKPSFSEWPHSWQPYQKICDDMPYQLHKGDPEGFRRWLTEELRVDLNAVMLNIRQHWDRSDRQLLGFLACLSCLKNAYRWGALPALQTERDRTSMEFPDVIDKPLKEVAKLHGVNPFCHVFSIHMANTVYQGDEPIHTRFTFNTDPKIIKTEENFILSFVKMEKVFQPAVDAIQEYCALSEEASNSYWKAIQHLARRVELLKDIQKTVVAVGKVFIKFTRESMIDRQAWGSFVQVPVTWGLDGKGGGSGGEALTFQLLDAFLHVPGEGLMFKSKTMRQENMPDAICNIVNAMAVSDPGPRFSSYLGIEQNNDPLWREREAILKSLYLWRLGHAHVVGRVLKASQGLASTMEKKMDYVETIASAAEHVLLERARETQDQFKKTDPLPTLTPKSDNKSLVNRLVESVNKSGVSKYVGHFLESAGTMFMSTFLA